MDEWGLIKVRILIIHDLGTGPNEDTVFTFIRHFSTPGDEVVLRILRAGKPCAAYLTDAKDFDLVVAAAGDSIISTVCYELRYSVVPVLAYPSALENLLVTALDIPDEPVALAALVHQPYLLDLSLGELIDIAAGATGGAGASAAGGASAGAAGMAGAATVAGTGAAIDPILDPTSSMPLSSDTTSEFSLTKGFVVAAGAGFNQSILKAAEGLKNNFGSAAYVLAALSHANPQVAQVRIEIDDQTIETEAIAVLLLNQDKLHVDPEHMYPDSTSTSQLEVSIIKPHNPIELLPVLLSAVFDRNSGLVKNSNAIEAYLGKTVRVSADPPLPLFSDSPSPGTYTPFEARILPAATRLIVPERTYLKYTQAEISL
ncbi:MAG: hypothetical protein FWD45_03520 [Coriobacteriia bacterium]|nr:hypothetical protein [Coriobacteriia bacterium]